MPVTLSVAGNTTASGLTGASAGWFGGPQGPLFGVLHLPTDRRVRGAVVLCPPLQFEYYTAHFAYRRLAESLAGAGLAALRLDYTGTGDSHGDPADLPGVDPWLADIRRAVDAMREAGAPAVGLVGMRMGATLAHAAACAADFEVLWDPCITGRRYLKEATLLARLVLDDSPDMLADLERDDIRILGYDFPASFAAEVADLELNDRKPLAARTLLLTRDGTVPRALRSWEGGQLEVMTAVGQERLLVAQLDLAEPPLRSIADITRWCASAAATEAVAVEELVRPSVQMRTPEGAVITETVTSIGHRRLFAIATEPAGPPRLTLACINSGAQHRIGPNRLYVDAARILAGHGVRTLRLDLTSIGDSPTVEHRRTALYWPVALDDLEDIMEALAGLSEPVALSGLCSGAYHALEAASRYPVRGVYAMHPVLDLGKKNNWPELADDRRRIWIRDRAWVRALNRFKLTERAKWHLPRWFWAVCDVLGLQPELSSGIRAIAGRGDTQIVLRLERSSLERRRVFRLRRAAGAHLEIQVSEADHALVSPTARRDAREALVRAALGWRAPAGGAA